MEFELVRIISEKWLVHEPRCVSRTPRSEHMLCEWELIGVSGIK